MLRGLLAGARERLLCCLLLPLGCARTKSRNVCVFRQVVVRTPMKSNNATNDIIRPLIASLAGESVIGIVVQCSALCGMAEEEAQQCSSTTYVAQLRALEGGGG